ncbi:MAG: ATP-binding cassette domain-containing protein [Thiolinea sp.]
MTDHLLEVCNLSVTFHSGKGSVAAVKNVSWYLDRGEVLAILGESGSGKSVSAAAIMDLLDIPPAEIVSGKILFDGQDLLTASKAFRQTINGKRIAMIFKGSAGSPESCLQRPAGSLPKP